MKRSIIKLQFNKALDQRAPSLYRSKSRELKNFFKLPVKVEEKAQSEAEVEAVGEEADLKWSWAALVYRISRARSRSIKKWLK